MKIYLPICKSERAENLKTKKSGFSLIELLIVIAVIAIITVVARAIFSDVTKKAQDAKAKSDIVAMSQAYEANFSSVSGYQALNNNQFATKAIPTASGGGNYFNDFSTTGFRVCTAISGGSNPCSASSPTCFCKESTQGTYIASVSPSPSPSLSPSPLISPSPSPAASLVPSPIPSPSSLPNLNPMPANYMVFNSDRSGHHEIYAMDLGTNQVYQLTNNASYDSWWGRLSPDRTKILFYRNPPGQSDQYDSNSLWMMNSDGTNQHQIIPVGGYGWAAHGHAEWLKNSNRLIMFGGSAGFLQIVGTDIDGQNAEIYTLHAGSNVDPSPNLINDSNFLFIGCPSTCTDPNYEVFKVSPKVAFAGDAGALGTLTQLTNDASPIRDQDPYFSPDTTKIAWLRNAGAGDANPNSVYWSIWVMNADGTGKTPVVADNFVNSRPEWSKDGQWIYFHRFVNTKFDIYKIHPNGTGLTAVTTSQTGTNEYPSL